MKTRPTSVNALKHTRTAGIDNIRTNTPRLLTYHDLRDRDVFVIHSID